MKPKRTNRLQCLTVCLNPATIALSVFITLPALATDAIWNGTAADNIYSTAGNWTPATAPTANGDTATWNGTQAGALSLQWTGGIGGYGGNGVTLILAGGQTSPVSLNNPANANQLGLTGISIDPGAGAFTLGGATGSPIVTFRTGATGGSLDPQLVNDSTSLATIKSNVTFNTGSGVGRAITFDGSGNWQVDNPLTTPNGAPPTVAKYGTGTLTITNVNTSQNNGYSVNDGTLRVAGAGLLGGPSGTFSGAVSVTGTLSYQSSASQTITSAISGSGALTQGAGTLTLTGNNGRTGTTTVTGGTMVLGGTGQMASSDLTINGASAKFVQTSSVASTMPIALTQGTLDGTGSVGAVTVGNNTGGIVKNGNGGTGALTISDLSFSGAGSLTFAEDGVAGTPGVIVTGALVTTPANGLVTVNASQSSWASGTTFDLLTFGSFAGAVGNFTKGTIAGLSVRQNSTLVLGANKLSLQITGDNPVWTGLDSGNWVIGNTGAIGNWKLITAGTKTDYVAGDTVLFDDSITTGTTAVNISAANVSPALVSFNNSTRDYTVSGGFGIAAGSVIKTGSGKVTLSTANTYIGGTTVSAGTLALSGVGTLGAASGALTVNGSGIIDLGATSRTVGTISLSGSGAITNGTITPTAVSATSASAAVISAAIAGSGSLVQAGSGSLTLSGANSYTGGTTATSGTLLLSGAGTLGSTTGALNLNGATLDLGTTSQTVGTVTKSGAGLVSNGTLAFAVFNDTHTVGNGTVSAKLTGTGALNMTGGGGTLILTAANDYTGPTNLSSGTVLRIGDGGTTGSLSPASTISMDNGARFSINRSDTVTQETDFGLLLGINSLQGGIILTGTGTTIFNLENTFSAGGSMSAGIVVAASSGALGSGANGAFNITGGSLQLKNDITLPVQILTYGEATASNTVGSVVSTGNNTLTGAISFNNAGTGGITNIVSLSGKLTINGVMNANAFGRTFNFGGAGNVDAFGGITGDVSVSKSGPGTTSLMSFNDYTGGTTIQAGTLSIQGSIAGPTTIDGSGAVLAGTGFVSGDVILNNGGIAPGDGITPVGVLTLDNDLYLSPATSTFDYDLSPSDNTSDLLLLNALVKGGGTLTFNFSDGMVGETYTLFQFNSTNLTPTDASAFLVTGGTGTFTITAKALTYTVQTVVPVSGYGTWSTTNVGGELANQDFDDDGVENGIEYFMNAPAGFTASPPIINAGGSYSITWTNGGNIPASAYGTQFVVQTSPNLATWTDVPVGNLTTNTDGPGGQLKYILTGTGKTFARLVVTPN